jgi:hypothetical protein
MKIFDSREEAIEFAKNAPEMYKSQLQILKNYTFKTDEIYNVITSDFQARFKANIQFVPKSFKYMILTGNFVVYLVCDVIVKNLDIKDLDSRNIDFIKMLDLFNRETDSLIKLFPFFKIEPDRLFNEFSKYIALNDVKLSVNEIIFK